MQKHYAVRAVLALLACLLAGAIPAAAQNQVVYRWNTGAIQGEPIKAGRNVTVRLTDLNPLCYAYSVDAKPHLAKVDLQRLMDALSAPAAAVKKDSGQTATATTSGGAKQNAAVLFGLRETTARIRSRIAAAEQQSSAAVAQVNEIREDFTTAEAIIGLAEDPACDGTTSLDAALTEWASANAGDPLEDALQRISSARAAVRSAQANVEQVLRSAESESDASVLNTYAESLTEAEDALDTLDAALPTLVQRMIRARTVMHSAEADGSEDTTDVYVPQGSDSLYLVITRRELHPEEGKTAAATSRTTQLPVRNGMRFFVSLGAMASGLQTRDYQRVTRAYADTTKGVYSTYANVSRGSTFAFSPVLQGNVALGELWGSGMSLLGSAGIAVRPVNGSNAPEFLLGGGLSFLDRMILTTGVHLGRRERLLIGRASEVEARPVPQTVTDASAIGLEWKPAFVTTFSIRLN